MSGEDELALSRLRRPWSDLGSMPQIYLMKRLGPVLCWQVFPPFDCRVRRARVAEWIGDVTDDDAPSRRKRIAEPSLTPEHPERGLDCVLDMLEIYHDDLDERDFTSMQLQRITIAAHNLLMVVQEIRKSAFRASPLHR